MRCSTKIWRNYTTRSSPSPSCCHTHPSSSTSSQTFSNLFLTSHNLFIHLSALFGKLNPFHKNTGSQIIENLPFCRMLTSGKTMLCEFTKNVASSTFIEYRTFCKLDQFGVGRYGHQCRQGDKHALTKTAFKCCNLATHQIKRIYIFFRSLPNTSMTFTIWTLTQVFRCPSLTKRLLSRKPARNFDCGNLGLLMPTGQYTALRLYCTRTCYPSLLLLNETTICKQ